MSKLEVLGAVVTIAALVSNNVYQRRILRSKSAVSRGRSGRRGHGEIEGLLT
jgi:hypothetical protein